MGLADQSDGQLRELMRLSWILANLVNGGRVSDSKFCPEIRFSPGVADLGTWGCSVTIDYTNEGKGRGQSTVYGTIESCTSDIRKELRDRLGSGYV